MYYIILKIKREDSRIEVWQPISEPNLHWNSREWEQKPIAWKLSIFSTRVLISWGNKLRITEKCINQQHAAGLIIWSVYSAQFLWTSYNQKEPFEIPYFMHFSWKRYIYFAARMSIGTYSNRVSSFIGEGCVQYASLRQPVDYSMALMTNFVSASQYMYAYNAIQISSTIPCRVQFNEIIILN